MVLANLDKRVVDVIEKICELDNQYPDPEKHLGYGTAGYRAKADLLPRAFFRVGVVIGMRARCVGRVGVMITASHNQHQDNGIKIVEPDGSMLVQDWEGFSEIIVNSKDLKETLANA